MPHVTTGDSSSYRLIIMRMCRILFIFKHFKNNKTAKNIIICQTKRENYTCFWILSLHYTVDSSHFRYCTWIQLNCYEICQILEIECFAFDDEWDCWLFIRALRRHWNKTSDILPQQPACGFTTRGFYWLLPGCNTVASVKSMMSDTRVHDIDRGRGEEGGFVPLS